MADADWKKRLGIPINCNSDNDDEDDDNDVEEDHRYFKEI